MDTNDFKRLAAAQAHEHEGEKSPVEIEVLDEGYQISSEVHPFYMFYTVKHKTLTIEHDVNEQYIVCDTLQEVDTLIALLQRVKELMEARS